MVERQTGVAGTKPERLISQALIATWWYEMLGRSV